MGQLISQAISATKVITNTPENTLVQSVLSASLNDRNFSDGIIELLLNGYHRDVDKFYRYGADHLGVPIATNFFLAGDKELVEAILKDLYDFDVTVDLLLIGLKS